MAENLEMADKVKRSCESDNVGIFPCAGASNVGQISNKVGVELAKNGVGTMMCGRYWRAPPRNCKISRRLRPHNCY